MPEPFVPAHLADIIRQALTYGYAWSLKPYRLEAMRALDRMQSELEHPTGVPGQPPAVPSMKQFPVPSDHESRSPDGKGWWARRHLDK